MNSKKLLLGLLGGMGTRHRWGPVHRAGLCWLPLLSGSGQRRFLGANVIQDEQFATSVKQPPHPPFSPRSPAAATTSSSVGRSRGAP